MRLVNTRTFELEEFDIEDGLRYAILSHRWGDEEVTFKEMRSVKKAQTKKGFRKINRLCKAAASEGLEYAWIDTCCIDKRSSAELSEAINSMYRWYQKSVVCYAYLADVRHQEGPPAFISSEWFRRGWTLQELLAPQNITFFDCEWTPLGTKMDLLHHIRQASGITRQALNGESSIYSFDIATRLSWASNRTTTRPEDIAYSLLGLFDVNMPLLYGEGEKAFIRLQEEIIKTSNDHSIFAWNESETQYSGLLARSPRYFASTKPMHITSTRTYRPRRIETSFEYRFINRGISIDFELWPTGGRRWLAMILTRDTMSWTLPAEQYIALTRLDDSRIDEFVRCKHEADERRGPAISSGAEKVVLAANGEQRSWPSCRRRINVRQVDLWPNPTPTLQLKRQKLSSNTFRLLLPSREDGYGLGVSNVVALASWLETDRLLRMADDQLGTAAVFSLAPLASFKLSRLARYPGTLLLGCDFDYVPVCVIADQYVQARRPVGLPKPETKNVNECDISKMAIEDITCFETKGWSEASDPADDRHRGTVRHVEGQRGVWAFKVDPISGLLQERFGSYGWSIRIECDTDSDDPVWNVALSNDYNRPEVRSK